MGVVLLLSDPNNAHTYHLLALWSEICNKINEYYPMIQLIKQLDYRRANLPKCFEVYYVWFPQIIYFPDKI